MFERETAALRLIVLTLLAGATCSVAAPIPLTFEENVGQVATQVRFFARTAAMTAYLEPAGATLAGTSGSVRLHWVGIDPLARVRGEDLLPARSNYFSVKRSYTGVPRYERVRYESLYPGIDLIFRIGGEGLEYDFVLAAGADPTQIAMRVEGATKTEIGPDGSLLLLVGRDTIKHHRPHVYQEAGDGRRQITCDYRIRTDGAIVLALGSHDSRQPLVIDPVISFSTRIGGVYDDINADSAYGVAVDSAGNAYVTGAVASLDFPTTPGAYSRNRQPGGTCGTSLFKMQCSDVFVMKLDRTGALIYSTYLGGADIDIGHAIAVDAGGSAYVTGSTRSSDFPTTPGAMRTTKTGRTCVTNPSHQMIPCEDAFIVKLNSNGSGLVYSSYLGGGEGRGVAVYSDGSATVGGWALSADFPVTNPVRENRGVQGAFIARLNPTGTELFYSCYLGAGSLAFGVALDPAGNGYITGYTETSDFPMTPGAFNSQGGTDAFVVKVSSAGALIYSARIGGTKADGGSGIVVDPDGNAYIAGVTDSGDFPVTRGPFAGRTAPQDAFVTKLDASGSKLVYSVLIGGSNDDGAVAVSLDGSRNAYVLGRTASSDIPLTSEALRPCRSSEPMFLTVVDASGGSLLHSTYFGGNFTENPTSLAVDLQSRIWLAGGTRSPDFPTTSPAPNLPYARAVFISKIDLGVDIRPSISCVASAASVTQGSVSPGEIVTVFGSGIGPDGPTGLRLDESGKVTTALANTRLWFDNVPASLLYVQTTQINAVVPYTVQGRSSVAVRVERLGYTSAPISVPVVEARPAVFTLTMTGSGQGAILNQDGSINSPENPATEGSVIAIWATGFGQTIPAGIDGALNTAPYPKPVLPVRVLINGIEAEVQYAGAAPGYVAGAFQINAKVPVGASEYREPEGAVGLIAGESPYPWPWTVEVAVK